ncbi:MAG TPA: hypothetical protein VJ729_11340 [Nitrososphaeraceae archaeon]|nr:hypothetical protein [Nitrososphaeraceae archaeon]
MIKIVDIASKIMSANTNNKRNDRGSSSHQRQQLPSSSFVKSFVARAHQFMKDTEQHALQGVNPGGIYQAIWSRDASFILRSWFHSGNVHGVLQQISTIWSHQIVPGKEKIIYGRGSPEMNYKPAIAKEDKQKLFVGALPTTMYQTGYSEVYGLNPDIDSTALMISTTSWILTKIIRTRAKQYHRSSSSLSSDDNNSNYYISEAKSMTEHTNVIDFIVPSMLKAIDHLLSRDTDDDGLLEQNHNEDWMDTGLRAGKIVYSQACMILALNNLSYLLSELNNDNESERMTKLATRTISAVEKKLWSENDGSYIDIQQSHHIGGPYRTITQDVSLYLVAISENTNSDSLRTHEPIHMNPDLLITSQNHQHQQRQEGHPLKQQKDIYPLKNLDQLLDRAHNTLDAISNRVWLDGWPTNVETLLKSSGPWHLKPYFYHNRTFWPWITGIEILARSRFSRFDECDALLSKLASADKLHTLTFYEWVNPKTGHGGGSYPFRTGICTVRTAIDHVISYIEQNKMQDRKNH